MAGQDYLNSIGQGTTKLACVWFTSPLPAFFKGFEVEGRMWHHHRNKILVIYTVLPNKALRADAKGLELPPASPETASLSKCLWSYAHPSGYSWHLLLKLFNNKAAFYKKLINGILFQSYVIWNSFHTLNFVWHFENTMPNSFVWIKNFFQT